MMQPEEWPTQGLKQARGWTYPLWIKMKFPTWVVLAKLKERVWSSTPHRAGWTNIS